MWMNRWIARGLEREKELVTRPGQRTPFVRGYLGVFLVLVLTYFMMWQDGWVQVVGQLSLSALAGWAVSYGVRVKLAYRSGWLDGRSAMIHSLSEGLRRGLSPADWVRGEAERDMLMMGWAPLDLDEDGPPPGHHDNL